MYRRITNSEKLVANLRATEKQISEVEAKRFEQSVGYVSAGTRLLEKTLEVTDLDADSGALSRDLFLLQLQ